MRSCLMLGALFSVQVLAEFQRECYSRVQGQTHKILLQYRFRIESGEHSASTSRELPSFAMNFPRSLKALEPKVRGRQSKAPETSKATR